jgi:hypothetical protein
MQRTKQLDLWHFYERLSDRSQGGKNRQDRIIHGIKTNRTGGRTHILPTLFIGEPTADENVKTDKDFYECDNEALKKGDNNEILHSEEALKWRRRLGWMLWKAQQRSA